MRNSRRWVLVVSLLLVGACGDDGTSTQGGCRRDSDCPRKDQKCVVSTGVCVGFATPLTGPDGGIPDAQVIDR